MEGRLRRLPESVESFEEVVSFLRSLVDPLDWHKVARIIERRHAKSTAKAVSKAQSRHLTVTDGLQQKLERLASLFEAYKEWTFDRLWIVSEN